LLARHNISPGPFREPLDHLNASRALTTRCGDARRVTSAPVASHSIPAYRQHTPVVWGIAAPDSRCRPAADPARPARTFVETPGQRGCSGVRPERTSGSAGLSAVSERRPERAPGGRSTVVTSTKTRPWGGLSRGNTPGLAAESDYSP